MNQSHLSPASASVAARRTSLTIQAALGNGRCGDDADAPETFRDRLVRYDSEKPNTTNI